MEKQKVSRQPRLEVSRIRIWTNNQSWLLQSAVEYLRMPCLRILP